MSEIKNGDTVRHIKDKHFGKGIVVQVRNTTAWVQWKNGLMGTPHLNNLEKVSDSPSRQVEITYNNGELEIVYTPTLAVLVLTENIRRVEVLR